METEPNFIKGIGLYQCVACPKTFVFERSAKRHMEREHGNK